MTQPEALSRVEELRRKSHELFSNSYDGLHSLLIKGFDSIAPILSPTSDRNQIRRALRALDYERKLATEFEEPNADSTRRMTFGFIEVSHLTFDHLTQKIDEEKEKFGKLSAEMQKNIENITNEKTMLVNALTLENEEKSNENAAIKNSFQDMENELRSELAEKTTEIDQLKEQLEIVQKQLEETEKRREDSEKMDILNLTTRIASNVGGFAKNEISLIEVRDAILTNVGDEKYGMPSLKTVFKCYILAASLLSPELSAKYGHVLAYCLLKKIEETDYTGREDILKGIAAGCSVIVAQKQWEGAPKIWETVAEVLINAIMPEKCLFEDSNLTTLTVFKDSFLNAAQDTRKPYTLFVLVLKRMAEMHYERYLSTYMEASSLMMEECKWVEKCMDVAKLDKALKATKMEFADNLHAIVRYLEASRR